jgi:hypothetical protein
VIVQSMHIQQAKLETDGGAYHPGEQLEEAGVEPTQEELTEANLSEEEVEQQLSDETAELESAAGWQANATEEENNMGDQDDLPFDVYEEEECSREDCKEEPANRAAGRGHRGGKRDDVEVSTRNFQQGEAEQKEACKSSREATTTTTKRRGAGGQLQRRVWDPGGFQQQSRGAHEKELMIFPAVEYDAGASLHLSSAPTFHLINAHSRRGEAPTLSFFPHFKF